MLYMEEGKTLKLLPGVPRKWLEDGKKIEMKNVCSYFGPISLTVRSNAAKGFIEANIECNSDRKPDAVWLRLPHPDGKVPKKAIGGIYDNNTESVKIEPFKGLAKIRVEYQ